MIRHVSRVFAPTSEGLTEQEEIYESIENLAQFEKSVYGKNTEGVEQYIYRCMNSMKNIDASYSQSVSLRVVTGYLPMEKQDEEKEQEHEKKDEYILFIVENKFYRNINFTLALIQNQDTSIIQTNKTSKQNKTDQDKEESQIQEDIETDNDDDQMYFDTTDESKHQVLDGNTSLSENVSQPNFSVPTEPIKCEIPFLSSAIILTSQKLNPQHDFNLPHLNWSFTFVIESNTNRSRRTNNTNTATTNGYNLMLSQATVPSNVVSIVEMDDYNTEFMDLDGI